MELPPRVVGDDGAGRRLLDLDLDAQRLAGAGDAAEEHRLDPRLLGHLAHQLERGDPFVELAEALAAIGVLVV